MANSTELQAPENCKKNRPEVTREFNYDINVNITIAIKKAF
jgi:hypothetical protein